MLISAHKRMNGCRQCSLRIEGVDEYLTEAEVAELLKVSVGTVRRWRREASARPCSGQVAVPATAAAT